MMKKFINIFLAFMMIFTFSINADRISDFDYDSLPDQDYYFYAYDETGTLSEASKKFIIDHSSELYDKAGVQVVVAVVNDLNDMTIESYATRLFEKWEIGDKNDQGLLILVKPKTASSKGEVRIEVGYGLMKIMPAQRANQVIQNVMIPEFKDGNMEKGIMDGYNISLGLIADYLGVKLEGIRGVSTDSGEDAMSAIRLIILLLIIFFLLRSGGRGPRIFFNPFRGRTYYGGRGGRGGFGGGFGGGFSGGGGRSGGGGSSGSW